jgi:hypothetical protein
MAIVNRGVKVNVDSDFLPVGYNKPAVTIFTDYEYIRKNILLTVAKSAVENANPVTTMTALVAALVTAMAAAVDVDFDIVANTVTIYGTLEEITTNFNLAGVEYTNGAINYIGRVTIYIKTAVI